MSTQQLLTLNLRNLFRNWTLVAWACFMLIMAIPFILLMGWTGHKVGWNGGDDGFILMMSLMYNISIGFQFCSVQMEILTRPFAYFLPRYNKVAFLSMVSLGMGFNGLCILLVLFFGQRLSFASISFLIGIFIFGVGTFVLPLWIVSIKGSMSRYYFILFPLMGASSKFWVKASPNQISNPFLIAPIGCAFILIAFRRLNNPAVIRSFVGRNDVLSVSWDKTTQQNAQRDYEKASLQKRRGFTLFEKMADRFFDLSHQSAPISKLLMGIQYMVFSRLTMKLILSSLFGGIGFALVYYFMGNMEGRAFIDSYCAIFVSLGMLMVVLGLFNIPAYFYQLPQSRRDKWRVIMWWNLFRAGLASILVFIGLFSVSIFTNRLQPIPYYFYDPLRHLLGHAIVTLFLFPIFVFLELCIESVAIRAIVMIVMFIFWPGIPLLWPPYTSLLGILFLEWILIIFAVRNHGLNADLSSNKKAVMWGWAQ